MSGPAASRGAAARGRIVAAACGLAAALSGLLAMLTSQDGRLSASGLVRIASPDAIAPYAQAADPHFQLVPLVQHYDGEYYYAIARDPLLLGRAHTLIDQPAYRYGHPLHGWLAGLLSLGQAREVPTALLVLSLLGLGVGAWAVSRLSVHLGRTPWGGLLVAVSPGLLFAATVSTTETVGVALIACTFLAWVRGRWWLAAVLVVAVCLDKEQYVTVPLGLAVWEVATAVRAHRAPVALVTKAVALVTGPVVLAGWYCYVHARIGAWPFSYQPGNIGRPLSGWRQAIALAHALDQGSFEQAQIGSLTAPVLIATAVVLVLAALRALRLRTVLDATLLAMVVITSMQGYLTLTYPHELLRTPAVALLLAVAVLLARHDPLVAELPT